MNNDLTNDSSNNAPPLWQKFGASTAKVIVHLWPNETKDWGRAFQAELSEIESPWQSFRWLIGGVMLLTREHCKSFLRSLRRPLGVSADSAASLSSAKSGPTPRLPRIVTAIFLLTSLTLLCSREVRTSLASVLFSESSVDWDIQKLKQQAQANHDPQLLAFLSLCSWDNQERTQLAEEAIRRDPSLFWIDYASSYWYDADTDRHHFLSDEKIARLQKFDPQNAMPLLLSAEVLSHPVQQAYFAHTHDSALVENRSWQHEIAQNPAWLAAMDRAFSAPTTDNYWSRHLDLIHAISTRYRLSNPDLIIAAFIRHHFVDYSDVHAYSLFLLNQGDNAAKRGAPNAAAADYQKIESFAEKLRSGNPFGDGDGLAIKIGEQATQKLENLYVSTNRPEQAQLAAAQRLSWEKLRFKLIARWDKSQGSARRSGWSNFEKAGLLIYFSSHTIAILLPATILVLLCVAVVPSFARRILGGFYRFVCLFTDAAPIFLALAFALLFFAYHPYAAFASNPQIATGNLQGFFAIARVTHSLPKPVGSFLFSFSINRHYYFWFSITTLLSAAALFLIYRQFRRQRTKSPQIP